MKNYKVTFNNRNFIVNANNKYHAISKVKNSIKLTDAESNVFSRDVIKLIIFSSPKPLNVNSFSYYRHEQVAKLDNHVYVYTFICDRTRCISHEEMIKKVERTYKGAEYIGSATFCIVNAALDEFTFNLGNYYNTLNRGAKNYFGVR